VNTELWRPVPGWEFLYSVSSHGRMWSVRQQKVMRLPLDAYGYPNVGLCRGAPTPRLTVKVHRLVALAFLGAPPDNAPEVDHIDHVRTNNRIENLRWASVELNRVVVKSRGASGVVGVRYRSDKCRWQAYVGRTKTGFKSLGHFDTKPEAIAARKHFDRENPVV